MAKISNDSGITSGTILNMHDSLDKYVLSQFAEEHKLTAGDSSMTDEQKLTALKSTMSQSQRAAYEEYKQKFIAGQAFLNNNITEYGNMARTAANFIEGYKGKSFKSTDYYKPSTNFIPMQKTIEDKYAAQMISFFDVVSGKQASGASIIRKSIDGALTIQNRVGRGMSIQGVKDLRSKILGADVYIDLDTENLGGKNLEGKRVLTNMTEYAFNIYDIKRDGGKLESAMATHRASLSGFIGIKPGGSDTEVGTQAYYEAMIRKLESRNGARMTEEEFVTVNGLFKYGYGKGGINWDDASKTWNVSTAEENFRDVWDIGAVRKGLQRAVDAYSINQSNLDSRGLSQADNHILEVLKTLRQQNSYLGGQNLVRADIPWLNQYMSGASPAFKSAFGQEFGNVPVGFDLGQDKIIDRLPLMNTFMASENTDRLLGPHMGNVLRKLSGKTPLAGEVMGKMFGIDGGGAYHNALGDSLINAQLMIGAKPGESFRVADSKMMQFADEIIGNRNNSTQANYLKNVKWSEMNGRFLFRANESIHGNDTFAPHDLSFAMNDLVNGYTTFGGKAIGRDGTGKSFAQDHGPGSVRKHSLLSITNSGKIELGQGAQADAVRESIAKLHPNFGQDFFYYAEFTNVYDQTIAGASDNKKLNSKSYIIARSESELAAEISKLDAIGKRSDLDSKMNLSSSWEMINPADENALLEHSRRYVIKDDGAGNAVVEQMGRAKNYSEMLKEEFAESTTHTLQETAARSVRDEKYGKIKQAQSFLRNIDNSIGARFNNPAFKSIIANDLVASKASNPAELIAYYRKNGYNKKIISMAVQDVADTAKAVTSNSGIDMAALREHSKKAANKVISNSLGDITPVFMTKKAAVGSLKSLNYQFGKDFHLAQSGQIDALGLNADFYAKTAPLNDMILDVIDSINSEHGKNWGNTDKSDLYSQIYGSIKSDLARGMNTEQKRRIIDGSTPVSMRASEMNYFEIQLGENFVRDGRTKFANEYSELMGDTSRVFKISNLDGGFNIGSQLAARHNRSATEDTSVLARGELFKFIDLLKTYKGGDAKTSAEVRKAFADFGDIDKDINTNLLSSLVTKKLQTIVNNDPKLGKITPMYGMDTLNDTDLVHAIGNLSADNIAAFREKAIRMATDHSGTVRWNGDQQQMAATVNDYINRMHSGLNDIYGLGESNKQALMNNFGLSAEQAEYEQIKFSKAKGELGTYYHTLLSNASKAGLDVDFRDSGIYVGNGDNKIALDRMPTLYKDPIAGTLGMRYGNNEGALQMFMNVDKHGEATSRTSFGEALANMEFNMSSAFKGSKDKKNELNTFLSAMSNYNTMLMENPAISKANLMSVGQGFVYDYSNITKLLNPGSNIINYSKIRLGGDSREERLALEGMKERFKRAAASKDGINEFGKIFGGDKEIIGGILNQIRQQLMGSSNLDSDTKKLLSWVNFAYKDVHAAEGKGTIGQFGNDTYADYANMQRPNAWQQNSIAFDEEIAVKNAARNFGTSKETARSILGLDAPAVTSRSYLNQRGGKVAGRMYGTTMTMTALQTSTEQYQGMILSHYARKGNLTNRDRIIKDHIMNTSLYAQQGVVDSRLASAVVGHNTPQYIPASKEVLAAMDTMADTKKVQEETMGKLLPKFEIVNGKLQVKLQRQGKYVKRFDNIMNTLGYGGSEQQWLNKSQYGMASLKFFTHNGVEATEEQINATISGIGGTTADDMFRAIGVLKDTFKLKVHVDNLEESTYRKMSLGNAEKGMFDVLMVGLGKLNEGNRYLEALHTDTVKSMEIAKGSGIKIGDLLGKNIGDRHLAQIADTMAASGVISGATSMDFLTAMRKEKHAASAYLYDDIAAVAQNIVGGKIGGRISAFYSAEQKKHKVTNLIMENAMNLLSKNYQKQGLTNRQIHEKIKGIFVVGGKEGLEYDDNLDRILLKRSTGEAGTNRINNAALTKAMHAAGLEYDASMILDSDGKSMGTRYGLGVYYKGYNGEDILMGNAQVTGSVFIDEEAKITSEGLAASKWASDVDERLIKKYGESYTSAHRLIERGVAVGDREAFMMNQVKEDTAYSFLKGKLDDVQWSELTGHLNGKPSNKGLMEYYTRNAMSKQFITEEDRIFGNSMADKMAGRVSNGVITDSKYAHLQNIYKEFGDGQNISMQKAEQLYGLKENMKALSFHDGKYGVGDMRSMGFVDTDIRGLHVGQNGAANIAEQMDKNIYNNNLLIDMYGSDLGSQVADSERYVAMGRMPMRPYGDTVVNYDYQAELSRLQGSRNRIEELKSIHGADSQEVANAISSYTDKVSAFKKGMNADVLGKDGIFSNLSKVRMSMSSNAKAAGFIHLTAADLDTGVGTSYAALARDLKTTRKALTASQKDKAYVADIMHTAKINGKSLLEHYEKGNYYDVKFMSEEAFESMGLLDDKYVKSLGLGGREDLLKYYSENGVMGVTGRYPTIYNESFKPTMLYYNDKLAGHKMVMNAEGVGTAHGDFDGDTTATFMATYGKNRWTSAQMAHVAGMSEGARAKALADMKLGAEDMNAYNSIRILQEYNARGINQFQHGKELKDVTGMISESVTDHTNVGRDSFMGSSYANSWMPETVEKENLYRSKFNELHSRVYSDGKQRDFESVIKGMDAHLATTAYSAEEKEMYRSAVSFQIIDKMTRNAELTGFKKSSIGVANIPLFADRQLSQLAFGDMKNVTQRDTMLHTVQHMSEVIEQSIISSKNAQSNGLMEMMGKSQRFVDAHKKALYKGQTADLETFLRNDVTEKEINKFFSNKMSHYIAGFDAKSYDPIKTYIKTIGNLHSVVGESGINHFMTASKVGASINGVKKSASGMDFIVSAYGNTTMASNLMKHIGNIDDEFAGTMQALSEDSAETVLNRGRTTLIDGREYLSDAGAKSEIGNIVKGSQEMFAKAAAGMTGKSLALGALGIAGSFMVAAFAGGHTEPTQTQAMEMADAGYAASDFYATSPTLADNPVQGRQQQGYMVNVKGKTSRGDQHAQRAVKDAVYQSTSTNVNLSMNINSAQSNISDRDIENMVMGAIN